MKLTEEVDIQKLRIIRDNFSQIFQECYQGKMRIFSKERKEYVESTDEKTCLTLIDKWLKAKESSPEVDYYYTRNKCGRRYSRGTSLQGICRKIRHTIGGDIYYDVDIKNAHPVFLLKYCRERGINHPMLERYVEGDREAFLNLLIGRKIVKRVEDKWVEVLLTAEGREDRKSFVLKMLNGGGGGSRDAFQVPEIRRFYQDQRDVIETFWDDPLNKKWVDMANKSYDEDKKEEIKGYDNRLGTAINYYLCDVEDLVLQRMEEFFSERNIGIGAFCFDGCLVYRRDIESESSLRELLVQMSESIFHTTGLKLKFEIKEMDEMINLQGLSVRSNEEEERVDYRSIVENEVIWNLTHNEVASAFFKMVGKNYLTLGRTFYVYNPNTRFWELLEESEVVPRIGYFLSPIMREIEAEYEEKLSYARDKGVDNLEPDDEEPNENGKVKVKKGEKKTSKMEEVMKTKLKGVTKAIERVNSIPFQQGVVSALKVFTKRDSLFINQTFDNKPSLFAFSCGTVFDLDTGLTRKVQRGDYLTIHTGYPYPEEVDPDISSKIKNIIDEFQIRNPREVPDKSEATYRSEVENLEYLLTTIAQCLYGGNKYEKFNIWCGSGRNGKGTIDILCKVAFGRYYSSLDIGTLVGMSDKSTDSTNSSFANLKGIRMVMATEPEEGKAFALKTSVIKRATGNDEVNCRGLYDKTRTIYSPQFTLILQCNEKPALSSVDQALAARVQAINFPFQFTATSEEEVQDNIKRGDPTIKGAILTNTQYRDCFIRLLLDHFLRVNLFMRNLNPPSSVRQESSDYLMEQDRVHCWLSSNYEFDINTKGIPASQLYSLYLDATGDRDTTQTQFGRKVKGLFPPTLTHKSNKGILYRLRKRDDRPEVESFNPLLDA
jgi:phage/plasmid-associated DNA primase